MEIIIDAEFQKQIPPQTPEENTALKESILANGCRDPLTVWGNILIDGHNRFEICIKHNIPYQTVNRDFADRDEAAAWIDENQISRRNLPPVQMSAIRARYYNRFKSGRGGDRKSKCHDDTLIDAAKVTADKFGVSTATIKRDAAKAAGNAKTVKPEKQLSPHEETLEKTVIDQKNEIIAKLQAENKILYERIEELELELATYKPTPIEKDICLEAAVSFETLQCDCIDWQERAAIREFDGGLSRPEAEQAATADLRTCRCCKGIDFWESAVQEGVTVCRRCHPPMVGAEKLT